MGFFDIFKKKVEQKNSPIPGYEAIMETMSHFTKESLSDLPDDIFDNKENEMKAYMYFLGALDAIAQCENINMQDTISLLTMYLYREFKCSAEETGSLIVILTDNSNNPQYSDCMQCGGKTLIDWYNKRCSASRALSILLKT